MTPTAEIFNVASLASLAVLGALALRKVFGGEEHREERFFLLAVLLTVLLWLPVFYLFTLALPAYDGTCVIDFADK
jgi:hypothetical protein